MQLLNESSYRTGNSTKHHTKSCTLGKLLFVAIGTLPTNFHKKLVRQNRQKKVFDFHGPGVKRKSQITHTMWNLHSIQ